MDRHITDKPKTRDDGPRVREFTRIEREERPAPASVAAHRQPAERHGAKAREFLRIDRETKD